MGRTATKSPRSETALNLYINLGVSRGITREVMLSIAENRGTFMTPVQQKPSLSHGLSPGFDLLPRDFPLKQLWVERALTKGVDGCNEW